jgi:uncharacterized membrane protein YidH (DUF202 family)
MPTTSSIKHSHRSLRAITRIHLALLAAIVAAAAWLRGDQPIDDRGSDSSEKSLMIILAITIGATVTAAAVAYIATKTALFK